MIILIMILIIVLFLIFAICRGESKHPRYDQNINKDLCTNNNIVTNQNNNDEIDYKQYYRPKRYITTINELNFYNVLLEIAKEMDLILFSQVSLYNILETKPDLDYRTKTIYFNKIASKSIDFVLVDKRDCRIKLCIELDDITHRQEKRIQRDKFINQLFKNLEINLLRYPVYKVYYKDTLKKRIQESMKEHYYTN